MNDIYLRRRGRLHVKPGSAGATIEHLATVQKEVEQLGFVLTDRLMERLGSLSTGELTVFLKGLLKDLRVLVGAHRTFSPLYPGFPQQVVRLSEAELYLNAVQHYITLRRQPDIDVDRPALLNGKAPRPLDLGSLEDFERICTQLAGAKTSLAPQDKADLVWFVRQYRTDIFRLLPKKIPFKENLAILGAELLTSVHGEATAVWLQERMRTPTDVLRLAVALSGGDVSLAKPCKFKAMPRATRRFLLGLVEQHSDPTEDMRRWAERWKRLGEVLHPGEYAGSFPRAATGFQVIRDGLDYASFNGTVEAALAAGQVDEAIAVLKVRPGELTRRLDHLARRPEHPALLAVQLAEVVDKVSTPVLLQALTHFVRRSQVSLRAFFPKGDVAKVFAIKDKRLAIADDVRQELIEVIEAALLRRFSKLPALGRCFVDPVLSNYLVPFSQRSAAKALRTLVRGSRIAVGDSRFYRLFVWWMNGKGRADVDLAAVLFDADFKYVDALTYYNLRNYGGYHSGDVVDAPRGAAEFIDLDLQRLRELKVRYVVTALYSFTRQPYCDLPECFAGWMAREDLNSGEPFEARTVVDRIDVGSDSETCLPMAFDLEDRSMIWMDVSLTAYPRFHNNAHNSLSGVSLMLRALSALPKTDLHTLFSLHARARGELVDSVDQAEVVFGIHEGITPFDVDRIRADFL